MLDARETLVMQSRRRVVGWDQTWDLVKSLESGVMNDKPDVIVGVLRGGAIPALMLSQRVEVPVAFATCNRGDTHATLLQPAEIRGRKVLVVDDIAATGRTLAIVKAAVERAGGTCRTMALFYDPRVLVPPDHGHVAHEFIHFVWEKLEITPASCRLFSTRDNRYAPHEVEEYYGFDVDGLFLRAAPNVDTGATAHLIRGKQAHAVLVCARPASDIDTRRLAVGGFERHRCVFAEDEHAGRNAVAFKIEHIRRLGISTWYEADVEQALQIAKAMPVTDVVYWSAQGPVRVSASDIS